jgi:hypothetical protein
MPGEENPKIDLNTAATFHAAAISGAPAWPRSASHASQPNEGLLRDPTQGEV